MEAREAPSGKTEDSRSRLKRESGRNGSEGSSPGVNENRFEDEKGKDHERDRLSGRSEDTNRRFWGQYEKRPPS